MKRLRCTVIKRSLSQTKRTTLLNIRNVSTQHSWTTATPPRWETFHTFQSRYFSGISYSERHDTIQSLLRNSSKWNLQDWRASQRLLSELLRQPHSRSTVSKSFQLLDRMAMETRDENYRITTKQLNYVLDRWRIACRQRMVDNQRFSAPMVLERVEQYASQVPGLSLDSKTYSLIMATQIKQDPFQSTHFCQKILERMEKSQSAPPNAIALTHMMDATIASRQPDAAATIQSIFDVLVETADKNTRMMPSNKTLTRVLQAWVTQPCDLPEEDVISIMKQNIQNMLNLQQLRDSVFLDLVLESCSKKSCVSNYSISLSDALLSHVIELSDEYPLLFPQAKSLGRIIMLWKKSDLPQAPMRAEFWLDEMRRRWKKGDHGSPRHAAYSAVIDCWGRSTHTEAPVRAEAVWHRMIQETSTATAKDLETIVTLLRKDRAPEHAEAILRGVLECVDLNLLVPANVFLQVIEAWADSDWPSIAASRSHKVLSLYLEEKRQHPQFYSIDEQIEKTFCLCLGLWAQSDNVQAQARRKEVFEWMVQEGIRGIAGSNLDEMGCCGGILSDGTRRYSESAMGSNVSNAITMTRQDMQQRMKEAVQNGDCRLAEAILLQIQELYEAGNAGFEPDFDLFQMVIDAWLNSAEDGKAARANRVLNLAETMAQEGSQKLLPKKQGYVSVICAWSQSHSAEAPYKIIDLMRTMKRRHENGESGFALDGSEVHSCLIEAFANSGEPESAKMSQKIFDAVPDKLKDTRLYNALIYSQGGDAISAEAVLQDMHRSFMDGNQMVCPDTESFNRVLLAWSRSGSPMAAWRADGIFNRMCSLEESGELPVKPNSKTFDMVISTLANELGADATLKVEHYLELLKEYYQSGNPDCAPTVKSYTEAIRVWGSVMEDPRALLRAKALLDEMHELARAGVADVTPDQNTYSIYLRALARSAAEEKADLARDVAKMMKLQGIHPEGPTLESLQRCLLPTKAILSGWAVRFDEDLVEL